MNLDTSPYRENFLNLDNVFAKNVQKFAAMTRTAEVLCPNALITLKVESPLNLSFRNTNDNSAHDVMTIYFALKTRKRSTRCHLLE